jgi:hypothetical protein
MERPVALHSSSIATIEVETLHLQSGPAARKEMKKFFLFLQKTKTKSGIPIPLLQR